MTNINLNNPTEIRMVGIQALRNVLGPVGTVRFIQQYDTGYRRLYEGEAGRSGYKPGRNRYSVKMLNKCFACVKPAQSIEHSAVNRSVVGSSPTGGAHKARKSNVYGFYLFFATCPFGEKGCQLKKAGI